MKPDIRWQQRLNSYEKAFLRLKDNVEVSRKRPLSQMEKQGLVKAFEFTHELAWNTMKDFYEAQDGNHMIQGSRDAFRLAFKRGLIQDGETWMDMIKSRNETSHIYDEKIADEITNKIIHSYFSLFEQFFKKMTELKNK